MAYIKIPLKNILNISRIVTLYYYDFSPSYRTNGEAHDFWEIVYVDSGELELRGGDRIHHLKSGEMIFHKPNEFHSVMGDGVHKSSVFIITFECRSPAMQYFGERVINVPKGLRGQMQHLIEECARNFQFSQIPLEQLAGAPIGGLQMIRNYLECFLISLMREGNGDRGNRTMLFTSKEHLEDSLAEDMIAYMKNRVHSTIRLEEMSRHFHFGVSTLCGIFKKNTGKTILHFFLEMKINEAKRMLHEEHSSISEISETLGFESPQYFSRMFHRYAGISPRDFRNSVAKQSNLYAVSK